VNDDVVINQYQGNGDDLSAITGSGPEHELAANTAVAHPFGASRASRWKNSAQLSTKTTLSVSLVKVHVLVGAKAGGCAALTNRASFASSSCAINLRVLLKCAFRT